MDRKLCRLLEYIPFSYFSSGQLLHISIFDLPTLSHFLLPSSTNQIITDENYSIFRTTTTLRPFAVHLPTLLVCYRQRRFRWSIVSYICHDLCRYNSLHAPSSLASIKWLNDKRVHQMGRGQRCSERRGNSGPGPK